MKFYNLLIKYRFWAGIASLIIGLLLQFAGLGDIWAAIIFYTLSVIAIFTHFFIGPLRLVQEPMENGDVEQVERIIKSVWFPRLLFKPIRSSYYTLIGNKNGLNVKQHTEFLNKGLMVIQNSRWGEITRRLFEGMACGKLVIADRLNDGTGLAELFIENEDIILYDSMIDCIEKINYYSENKEERERIAMNGMKKVIENYTQIQLVDKLINKWKNYQLV